MVQDTKSRRAKLARDHDHDGGRTANAHPSMTSSQSYKEIVVSIAAQYDSIQGQFCKEPGSIPVYLAPADICGHDGLKTALNIHVCKDYPKMETDYSNLSHHLVCVSSEELGELWDTGHCHDS